LLLALVILGFGLAALSRGTHPLDLPVLFHIDGLTYITWVVCFSSSPYRQWNRGLHKKLSYSSVIVIAYMLVIGFMVATHSYEKGVLPTVQQFVVFPVINLNL
jgi:hypothetical protein